MNPKHNCGYISLTLRDKSPVLVRASKITHISSLGDGGMTAVNFGQETIIVQEKLHEVIERIDFYIAPELR